MGKIITFYSFKGGVGRTMALANIACLLARRGKRVLVIDMDLEAPGLHHYLKGQIPKIGSDTRGMAGLLSDIQRDVLDKDVDAFTMRLNVPEGGIDKPVLLDMIPSGIGQEGYEATVLGLDWQAIFSRNGGEQLERIRETWRERYDHVLVDSRTGITDAGGFCTIFLPDLLALVFTTNDQSFQGVIHIAEKAKDKRQLMAFDRGGPLILPILSRFDGRSQQKEAEAWLAKVVEGMTSHYNNWITEDVPIDLLLERTKIPHVPLFSFGEKLPCLTHKLTDPDLPGFYYENLAHLISGSLTPNSTRVAAGLIAPGLGDGEMDLETMSNILAEVSSEPAGLTVADMRIQKVRQALLESIAQGIRGPVAMRWIGACIEIQRILASLGAAAQGLELLRSLNDEVLKYLWGRPYAAEVADQVASAFRKLAADEEFLPKAPDLELEQSLLEMSLQLQKAVYEETGSDSAARSIFLVLLSLGDVHAKHTGDDSRARALQYFEQSLEISEDVYRRAPASAVAARDVSVSCMRLGHMFEKGEGLGDMERAIHCFERAAAIREEILGVTSGSAQAVFDLSHALDWLCRLYLRRGGEGDPERAVAYMERELSLVEDVLQANPRSAAAARDVSVSLNKLADFSRQRGSDGDAERALAFLRRSLEISEGILEANPGSAAAARDVSLSLERLSELYKERCDEGDAERALSCRVRGLAMRENILKANPGSASATRDLSVSLERLSDLYLERGGYGDAERALALMERALAMRERILQDSPGSPAAAREMSVSLNKLADFYLQRARAGDAERGLTLLERDLSIVEGILQDSTGSATAARDVSVRLERLCDLYVKRGGESDAQRALVLQERSLTIVEGIRRTTPGSVEAERDVCVSMARLGNLYLQRGGEGDAERALVFQESSLAIFEGILGANPDSASAVRDVVVSNSKLASLHRALGNEAAAIQRLAFCHQLLHGMHATRMFMDKDMLELLEELNAQFGEPRIAEGAS